MTLTVNAGVMTITDGARTMFTTADKIFHVLSTLSGSTTIAGVGFGGSGSPTARFVDTDLGAVDAACTHVTGICKITYSTGTSTLPTGYWYPIGGSIVYQHKRFQSLSGVWATYPSSIQVISFELSASHVRLRENTSNRDDFLASSGSNSPGLTVQYKVYAGVFT